MIATLLLLLRSSAPVVIVNVDFAGSLFAESFLTVVADITGEATPPATVDFYGIIGCKSFLTAVPDTT